MVFKITPTGQISVFAKGFTTILGVAFDSAGRLYVLENTTGAGNQFPTPGTGKVIRIDPSGNRTLIASGLFLPTAMTFGPDGALYVSAVGFGPPPVGLGAGSENHSAVAAGLTLNVERSTRNSLP